MSPPFLSIIVPTYTIEKYINECLDSIIQQTYRNLEIIIIDDHSKDSTPDIIQEYAKQDPRIKVILHKENKGPGFSRNKGLSLATGKYVTFMDHDDWQDLNKYEKMINRAEKTSTDIVFCNADEYKVQEKQKHRLYSFPKSILNHDLIDISTWESKQDLFNSYLPPWTKIIRRDLIKKNKIHFSEDGNLFDDVLFHYLSVISAKSISVIDEVLYTHRFFEGSISKQLKANPNMYFDDFKTWRDLEASCAQAKINSKLVFINYFHLLAQHCFKVKDIAKFVRMFQKIILKYNLKKSELDKKGQKKYKRVMGYSPLRQWLTTLQKKTISIYIKPKDRGYRLQICGFKIL